MLLVIDIGNTNITIGCLEEEKICFDARIATDRARTSDQYGVEIKNMLEAFGVQLSGILNWNEDIAYGLQVGTVNYDGEFYGLQIGGINWFVGDAYGASLGAFLLSNNSFTGFSAACLNYEMHKMSGFQLGGINLAAESSTGLQLGIVNISKHHEGLQLGLVNINSSGFLPCFPGLNFNFSR